MSISAVSANAADTSNLIRQRQQDLQKISGAGQSSANNVALPSYQADLQSLQTQTDQSAPISGYGGLAGAQRRLSSLLVSIQSQSATEPQAAPSQASTSADQTSSIGQAPATSSPETHAHHHHGGHRPAESASTSSQPTNASDTGTSIDNANTADSLASLLSSKLFSS